jgi:hypothetical protein
LLIGILGNELYDRCQYWAERLIRWAVSIQPSSSREMREEEWLELLEEDAGKVRTLVRALVLALHAPFTSRSERGLPLLRDDISERLLRPVRRCASITTKWGEIRRLLVRRRAQMKGPRAQHLRRIGAYLGRPTEITDVSRLFAWIGTPLLGLSSLYLAAGWRGLLDLEGPRPTIILVGWGLMRTTLHLNGYQPVVLAIGTAALVTAVALAIYTRGYQFAPRWANAASIGIGLTGPIVAIPFFIFLGIIIANVALWIGAIMVVALVVYLTIWITIALVERSQSGPGRPANG